MRDLDGVLVLLRASGQMFNGNVFDSTETQRIGNSHLRKVSVSESNVLLDEEVLTDPKIQALLLTVLVRKHTPQCSGHVTEDTHTSGHVTEDSHTSALRSCDPM